MLTDQDAQVNALSDSGAYRSDKHVAVVIVASHPA
jgi:hypothetical protein